MEALPVEAGAGVGFALRGDMTVAHDAFRGNGRISVDDDVCRSGQNQVLRIRIGCAVAPFQFDADGKIVASRTPAPAGDASMPGATMQWHVLYQFAVASDQQMRRDLQVAQ